MSSVKTGRLKFNIASCLNRPKPGYTSYVGSYIEICFIHIEYNEFPPLKNKNKEAKCTRVGNSTLYVKMGTEIIVLKERNLFLYGKSKKQSNKLLNYIRGKIDEAEK